MKRLVSFPRYEEYKDSGVDSIRKIPQHWGIVRFRNFFKFSRGLSITKENLRDEGIPCVSYGEVHSRFGFEVNPQKHELKCVSSDYLLKNKSSLIHQGDIVYADTSEDIEGSGNFTQLVTDDAVFAGYHTIVCRPIEEVNYRYIAYCLESLSFRKQIQKEVKGVKVFSITQAILKNTSIWLPFSEEQKLIATYLDQKTAQIDQAIDIKKKQIELLKERQQVVIQQAVTKGLNPSVKMKDSGIEWIGEVPEHWETVRFRNFFKFNRGLSITKENLRDEGIPCVSYGEVHSEFGFEVNPKKHKLMCVSNDYLAKNKNSLIRKGDVVYADTSEDIEGSGNFTQLVTNDIVFAGYHTIICKPLKSINFRYLAYCLDSISYRNQIRKQVKGVKVYSITQSILKNTYIWLPSDREQEEITHYLDRMRSQIKLAIETEERQIKKLQEYKFSLINSAVTGKIKITPDMIAAEE